MEVETDRVFVSTMEDQNQTLSKSRQGSVSNMHKGSPMMASRASLAQAAGSLRASVSAQLSGKLRSKEIDSYLAAERKRYEKFMEEPKVLILGSSDSGKSTLLKQLKIMHGGGFSDEEKGFSKKAIVSNIVRAMATLVKLCEVRRIQTVFDC
jgi:RecA-family ATPase